MSDKKKYQGGDFFQQYKVKIRFRDYVLGNTPLYVALGGKYAEEFWQGVVANKASQKKYWDVVIQHPELYRRKTAEHYKSVYDTEAMKMITAFPRTADEKENIMIPHRWIRANLKYAGTQLGIYKTYQAAGLKDTISRLSRISNLKTSDDFIDLGTHKPEEYIVIPGEVSGSNGKHSIVSKHEAFFQIVLEFGYGVFKSRANRIDGFDDLVTDLFLVGQEIGYGGARSLYGRFNLISLARVENEKEKNIYTYTDEIKQVA